MYRKCIVVLAMFMLPTNVYSAAGTEEKTSDWYKVEILSREIDLRCCLDLTTGKTLATLYKESLDEGLPYPVATIHMVSPYNDSSRARVLDLCSFLRRFSTCTKENFADADATDQTISAAFVACKKALEQVGFSLTDPGVGLLGPSAFKFKNSPYELSLLLSYHLCHEERSLTDLVSMHIHDIGQFTEEASKKSLMTMAFLFNGYLKKLLLEK